MNHRQRKEIVVSLEEIVHTCSNEKVAQAAVASLGYDFASRVRAEADCHGVTMGVLVAQIVREFGRTADARERHAVSRVMEKTDQPILVGLRFMLDAYLTSAERATRAPWMIAASFSRPEIEARPAR